MDAEPLIASSPVDVTILRSGSPPSEKTPLLDAEDVSCGLKRAKTFEEALDKVGVGFFHIILIIVAGCALASDSVEVQCISFVTPQLDNPGSDLHPTKVEEGLLDAIIFLGMLVGGYVWGSWSDVVGRRTCLITSLFINATFGGVSALSPNYISFLVFRFCSGVGVGGSVPVVFAYFCEFFTKRKRGPFVIVLATFWALGSVYASLLAWAVIEPLGYLNAPLGKIHITSWRVYVMLCTIPCLSAAIALIFLPESPFFYYSKGRTESSLKVLRRVKAINRISWSWGAECVDLSVLDENDCNSSVGETASFASKILTILRSSLKLFSFQYLRANLTLIVVGFTFSFGYYGLLLWFPEYFKCIHERELNCTFSLEDPDSCVAPGVNEVCNSTGTIYADSLYASLATIPGTILGVLLINVVGAKPMMIISMVVCGLSALLIKVVPTREKYIVILSAIFNGVSVFGWNALDVINTSELFPVHLRSTAFGIQLVAGRIGAILGNLTFGKLITVSPFIPIVIVAGVLMAGGVSGLVLPTPRGAEGSSRKLLSRCWRLLRRKNCKTRHRRGGGGGGGKYRSESSSSSSPSLASGTINT